MNNKQEFLDYLQASFSEYFADISQPAVERAQTKSFINGLMVAGKIFGVSSEELQQVLAQEQNPTVRATAQPEFEGSDLIEVPTYIRWSKSGVHGRE